MSPIQWSSSSWCPNLHWPTKAGTHWHTHQHTQHLLKGHTVSPRGLPCPAAHLCGRLLDLLQVGPHVPETDSTHNIEQLGHGLRGGGGVTPFSHLLADGVAQHKPTQLLATTQYTPSRPLHTPSSSMHTPRSPLRTPGSTPLPSPVPSLPQVVVRSSLTHGELWLGTWSVLAGGCAPPTGEAPTPLETSWPTG